MTWLWVNTINISTKLKLNSMKQFLLLFTLLVGCSVFGQQKTQLKGSTTLEVTYLGQSPQMRNVSVATSTTKGGDPYVIPNKLNKTSAANKTANYGADPVIQQQYNLGKDLPFVKQSIEGNGNQDNVDLFGGVVAPPDTQGDVGPNHYIQMVNKTAKIFDKGGNLLLGPVPNNFFFQNLDPRLANTNDGDPIVLYDQFVDRWIVSQFAVSAGDPYFMVIAVSTTPDPLGTYNQYAINYGSDFPDYPKLGVWNDAIYISTRDFAGGTTYAGFSLVAINKNDMYAGKETSAQRFEIDDPDFDGILPADADGPNPPPAGEPHYSLYLPFPGAAESSLNLITTEIDFENPGNSTLEIEPLPVGAYAYYYGGVFQPNGIPISTLPFFLMYRLQYMNFGTHASMLTNHSVQENPEAPFGIRWYEFRKNNSPWEVYQQGTYRPNDNLNRWMGSIAMNTKGEIALGYSVVSKDLAPSIRFTGQTADYSGTGIMNVTESSIIEGTLSSRGTNRWGDYSMMSYDPEDDDFWFTTEYIAQDWGFSGWGTKIAEFQLNGGFNVLCKDITIALNEEGYASITVADIDNGTAAANNEDLELSINITEFNCSNVGENAVMLTATNSLGQSSSCTATVTVLDVTPPVAQCFNITRPLNDAGEVTVEIDEINNESFDLCSEVTVELGQTLFTTEDLGVNQVPLTVTDASGNQSVCYAEITINAERARYAITPGALDITSSLNQNVSEQFIISNPGDDVLNYALYLSDDNPATTEITEAEQIAKIEATQEALQRADLFPFAAPSTALIQNIQRNQSAETQNNEESEEGDLWSEDFEFGILGDLTGTSRWWSQPQDQYITTVDTPENGNRHMRFLARLLRFQP